MEAVVSSVVCIRGISVELQQELRKRYTFVPSKPPGTPVHVRPSPVSLFKRWQDFVVVPRDMALISEMQTLQMKIADDQNRVEKSPISPDFTKSLDEARNQPLAVSRCIEALTSNPLGGGCLLSLPPGFGKTACSLYISSKIARRTLILVHTSVLASQWKDRVFSFLEKAVPMVVSSQKIPENLREATHVIVLLQTIVAHSKKGNTGWLENLHDMVIVDECHHICERTLCQVMEIVGGRFRLGLSATLQRKDGLDTMLSCLIGPIAFQCERYDEPNLTVRVVKHRPAMISANHHLSFVESVNAIAKDKSRLDLLVDIVKTLYEEGRHIIVLSDRLAQLHELRRCFPETHQMAIGGSKIDFAGDGGKKIVLATYQFASEGLDICTLDTCVLASPRVDVKQSVGRILRSPGGSPLVVDIVDEEFPILRRQFLKRKRFYTKSLEDGGLNAFVDEKNVGILLNLSIMSARSLREAAESLLLLSVRPSPKRKHSAILTNGNAPKKTKICQHPGCTKGAVAGGNNPDRCKAHGGGKRCQQPGCTTAAVGGGANPDRCKAHGGGKRCQHPGCTKAAAGGALQKCKVHGGGRRCGEQGCTKAAANGGTDRCTAHGGGKRCQHPGCTKACQGAKGRCIAHGGGPRCQAQGCTKAAQGATDRCVAHGGGLRCQHPGCTKVARGTTDRCAAHGGGPRCREKGCTKLARGATDRCKAHGGGKRCHEQGCTKAAWDASGMCQAHKRRQNFGQTSWWFF